MASELHRAQRARFESKDAAVGVVGLGYVGLPLCGALDRAGFRVVGFDVDGAKVEALGRGEPYFKHGEGELFAQLADSTGFRATTDFAALSEVDGILICVPTPLGVHREPDLGYVTSTVERVRDHLVRGQLVVLESTTYPGTTRDVVLPILEANGAGLRCGEDYFLAYSPEREDPGRLDVGTQQIPKLVGGIDEASTDLAGTLYEGAVDVVHRVASSEIAEASKILENTFRAVNVALVNEMKVLMVEMGIDIFDVVEAAATKPFGFMPFYPGPGLGGHCIPIDPFYLTWKAREFGISTRFVELAGEINSSMPQFVVRRTTHALNSVGVALNGARVLLLGMAYKKNVGDLRESPAFEVVALLLKEGAQVAYADPFVASPTRERSSSLSIERVELSEEEVGSYNVVVLLTDHDGVDYDLVQRAARLIVDTRGVFREGDGDPPVFRA